MPIPKPRKGESRKDFFDRCMGDSVMVKDFPEASQRGGVCSTAFDKKNNTLNMVSNFVAKFSVRTAQKDGKAYLVVPIVALREGVHCGWMQGQTACLFYSSSEISDTAQAWNGVPLTAFHPEINGELVNAEKALKEFKIGTFENVVYEAGALTGEGWIDIALAQAISIETLQMIRARKNMEVSTGVGLLGDQKKGTWNGESFDQSVFDFEPDHLALLPGGQGACSIKDGCGVIMNTKKECVSCKLNIKGGEKNVSDNEKRKSIAVLNADKDEYGKYVVRAVDQENAIIALKKTGYWVNELSHSKLKEKLNKIVNDMDKPGVMHFVREPFNTHFIFERFVEAENESKLFRQDFSINKHDEIKIKGDPVEVEEQLLFPVKANNKEGKKMANNEEQIAALIANEKFPQFTVEDTKWFKEMDENHFEKLHALSDCNCTEALEEELVAANDKEAKNVAQIKKLTEDLATNESKSKEKKNHIPTFEEVVNSAPVDMQEALQDGMRMSKEKRSKLIDALVANERCAITKDRLESKKTHELEELVALGNIPVDHSLKGNGGVKKYGPNEKSPDGYGVPVVPRMDEVWKNKK